MEMKISIITINYNHAEGLRCTIKSTIAQTFTGYEFIIIDGGSSDGSVDVIKEYANKIDYWVSEPDGGIYPAMNKGVQQAHGKYCIFMNSGDEFYAKDVLEKIVGMELKEDIVCGDIFRHRIVLEIYCYFPAPFICAVIVVCADLFKIRLESIVLYP